MSNFEALSSAALNDPQRPWRAMIRVECTGGNVNDAIEAQRRYLPQKMIYAEGDSWFDKFTPIPTSGTNLLDAIRLPYLSVVIDVSKIGAEASEMVSGRDRRQTKAMFDLLQFDAILLSAGGNDLKNLFAGMFRQRANASGAAPWSDAELQQFGRRSNYQDFLHTVVCEHISEFIALRDRGRQTSGPKPPIFIHGYDYLQPRPAGASVFAGTNLGGGPWLFPAMANAGLTHQQMRIVTDAVVDELNQQLKDLCAGATNVHYIDQRRLLRPAAATATGPDGDWLDEIHPDQHGFEKLARNRWDVPLAQKLGWHFGPGDLQAAAAPVNQSTALG